MIFIHHPSGMQYAPFHELRQYKDVSRIQYNTTHVKNFLIVDIDNPRHSHTYATDPAVPRPNIVISNREDFGKHLIWVLDAPVWGENSLRRERWLKINKALTRACGGDEAYTFHIAKNLFNTDDFYVHFNDVPNYSLDSFNDLLTDKPTQTIDQPIKKPLRLFTPRLALDGIGSRNVDLFNATRKYAYQEIKLSTSNKAFKENVTLYAKNFNSSIQQSLEEQEVLETVKSIVKYCLKNKKALRASEKKRGKMNLDEQLEIQEKQKLAAEYSAKVKRAKMEMRLKTALMEMKKQGIKITVSSVSNYTGIARTTTTRYKHLFL